jgi:hypothetical protein
MARGRRGDSGMTKRLIKWAVVLAAVVGGAMLWRALSTNRTIDQLLTENKQLKAAIANLTQETQVGYAKVLAQQQGPSGLVTRVRFVETDGRDLDPILQKEFEVEGDIVHFDALIVKFSGQWVMDGKERALFLWRRVYGEKMSPEQGFAIEEAGQEPARYRALTRQLGLLDRQAFWQGIWDLSNDPKRLEHLGIQAVFGNVVYEQMRPGRIYVFKAGSTGSLYPEVVPDL